MTTIAEIVAQSGDDFDGNNQDFDILLEAVQTADLVDALNDSEADLTTFAPTDAAFVQLAQDLGFEGSDEAGAFDAIVAALTELGEGDPIPLLKDILLYHVSAGAKTLETIQGSDSVSTLLEGATLTPNGNSLEDNEPDLIDPSFVEGLTDVEAENGVVQAIDRVLIPLDIPGNEEDNGDVLRGGRGADIQNGGSGNDSLMGGRGDDIQDGKGGDDILGGGLGADIQNGGNGNDSLMGGRRDDIQNGGFGADVIKGGRGDDIQNGQNGDDILRGGLGADIQDGGNGNDSLMGGRRDDIQSGGFGADVIKGGRGNDTLFGGNGHDTLIGGPGNDVLIGGPGNDTISGGRGEDIFVLALGEGKDQIIDFNLAEDSLSLAGELTFEQIAVSQGVGNQSSSALISLAETGELLAVLENVEAETINRGVFDAAMI